MRSLVVVLALAASATPSVARAEDDSHDRTWYGWETLSVDAALIGVFASYPAWPGFEGDGALLFVDGLAFFGAGPLVHRLNGHDSVVGTSIGLRLSFVAVGALLGFAVGFAAPCTCPSGGFLSALCFCQFDDAGRGAYVGTIAGAFTASLIDALAFAWKRPEPRETSQLTWTIAPFARPGGGGLSLGGTF